MEAVQLRMQVYACINGPLGAVYYHRQPAHYSSTLLQPRLQLQLQLSQYKTQQQPHSS